MKKGWTYKKLGEVFSSINNGANIKQIKGATGIPITRIETLSNDKFNRDRMGFANIENVTPFASYVLNEGDILMSHINSMKFLGRSVAYSKMGDETIIHGMNLLRLVPTTNVLSPFMIYQFQTRYFKDQILQISHQSVNQASFNITNLKGLNIMVPPLTEQERIVERLDAAFAQIDELKSNAERQLAEARALFQSALTQAMQPKPGWQEKTLGEIANIIHGKNQKEVISETGKYPIYGSGGNIMGYATDYLCEAGTTILGRKGSINNPQFINEKFWNVDTAFGISAKEDNDNKFIYYFIKSVDWSKKNTGTTLPSLTQSVVKSVSLFVPNLTDQQAISSNLDSLHAQISEIDRVNKRIAAECDALKQALLRQIFE